MPLNWSLAKCKDWESLKSDQEWPVTNALIWGTMAIGMNCITEENIVEFYARVHVWENLLSQAHLRHRNPETEEIEERPITPEDLQKRIGLSTNASSESRSKWLKRMNEYIGSQMTEYSTYAKRKIEHLDQKDSIAA